MNDDEFRQGIEALVVEATRDTPRLTPEQVAARAAAERQQAADAMYRRVPGLSLAVTDVVERFERVRRPSSGAPRGGSGVAPDGLVPCGLHHAPRYRLTRAAPEQIGGN